MLGGTYTLLALAWVVIYQGTRVLNFSIGDFMLYGALLVSTLSLSGLAYIPVLIIALLLVGVIGSFVYLSVIRPLTGRDMFSTAVLAIGVSIMLSAVASMAWGPELRTLPRPLGDRTISILGTPAGVYSVVNLVVALLAVGLLTLFFKRVRVGLLMRAAAENPLLASQRGVNIFLVFAGVWFLSGVLASLAGISYATTSIVSPTLTQLALRGLAPALLGGFRSIGGATIGAFFIALVETLGVRAFGGASQDAVVFAVLLLVIAVRPSGLAVRGDARRV